MLLAQCFAVQLVTASVAFSNEPPEVYPIPVYRTYPGFPISIELPAFDPDAGGEGGEISFSSDRLPAGSTLDSVQGVFDWTPPENFFGPYVIPFTVRDNGTPPLETQGEIPIKIVPLDMCTVPSCEPGTGCEHILLPVDESCCVERPEIRVADPEADCASGASLHIGRNPTSFGRLHNCDLIQVHSVQSGQRIRLHLETRCLDARREIEVHEKLEAYYVDQMGVGREVLLYERTGPIFFLERGDGWAQKLAQSRKISLLSVLEGADALYTITATDKDGVTASEKLRLTITLKGFTEDLPDPGDDTIPPPPVEDGCQGCHRPLTGDPSGEREGIEEVHPWAEIDCVGCHGGDDTGSSVDTAHVLRGDDPKFIKRLSSDRLDAIEPDYLRFVNPGDLRIAQQTCGQAGCHPEHVAKVSMSVMSTYAGHYTLPRYLVGAQNRDPIYAAVDIFNHDFDPESAPVGAIESFSALREVDPLDDRSLMSSVMDTYLPKACPTCHLNAFGRNKAAGTYRSSGCTACHMIYSDNGLSESDDPMLDKNFPPHPRKHELTSAIPVEQCAHCHFQGGRIGLAYRGIREGGFSPEQTPIHGTTLGESIYGHGPDFYFSDEDDTDGEWAPGVPRDIQTPADLHYDAGMVCVDCHVGGDVHGDGNLYRSERYQTAIRCEDCHGTVRAAILEDPEDGLFKNSRGDALKRLQRVGSAIRLELAIDPGKKLYVPQIHLLLEAGVNPRMTKAMGVDEKGFSHSDSLECYACHTSWRQTCFGCHITVDDSAKALNFTTGVRSPGLTSATKDDYSLDFFALGINERGKLAPLCSSMSIFLSYVDEDGVLQYSDQPRTSHDGKKGFGWNPFHHHTVSLASRPCAQCHPAGPGEPDNSVLLDATYGFGDGSVMVTDGNQLTHDLTQLLDSKGDLISDFPHPNTGPVPEAMRRRALAVPEPKAVPLGVAALAALAWLASSTRHSARPRSPQQDP